MGILVGDVGDVAVVNERMSVLVVYMMALG